MRRFVNRERLHFKTRKWKIVSPPKEKENQGPNFRRNEIQISMKNYSKNSVKRQSTWKKWRAVKSGELVGLGRCLLRILLLGKDLLEIALHEIVSGGGILVTIRTIAILVQKFVILGDREEQKSINPAVWIKIIKVNWLNKRQNSKTLSQSPVAKFNGNLKVFGQNKLVSPSHLSLFRM